MWLAKNIVLVEPQDVPIIQVQADPHALERVFRNLFENAIMASPDGVRVELGVRPCVLGDRPGVEVRVRDHVDLFCFLFRISKEKSDTI